eukprot:SM000123S25853  [mRNA]  locus=s123:304436:307251:+ [translate_table: standard]
MSGGDADFPFGGVDALFLPELGGGAEDLLSGADFEKNFFHVHNGVVSDSDGFGGVDLMGEPLHDDDDNAFRHLAAPVGLGDNGGEAGGGGDAGISGGAPFSLVDVKPEPGHNGGLGLPNGPPLEENLKQPASQLEKRVPSTSYSQSLPVQRGTGSGSGNGDNRSSGVVSKGSAALRRQLSVPAAMPFQTDLYLNRPPLSPSSQATAATRNLLSPGTSAAERFTKLSISPSMGMVPPPFAPVYDGAPLPAAASPKAAATKSHHKNGTLVNAAAGGSPRQLTPIAPSPGPSAHTYGGIAACGGAGGVGGSVGPAGKPHKMDSTNAVIKTEVPNGGTTGGGSGGGTGGGGEKLKPVLMAPPAPGMMHMGALAAAGDQGGAMPNMDAGGDGLRPLLAMVRPPPRSIAMHRSYSSHALGQLRTLAPAPPPPPPPLPMAESAMLPGAVAGFARVAPLDHMGRMAVPAVRMQPTLSDLQGMHVRPIMPPMGGMRRVHSTGDIQGMQMQMATTGMPGGPYDEGSFKIGRYTLEERKLRISRYRQKRTERNFNKKIKYACRKTLADSRPRVRGRFARNDEVGDHTQDDDEGDMVLDYDDLLLDDGGEHGDLASLLRDSPLGPGPLVVKLEPANSN